MKQTNGARLIKILEKEGAIEFMACLGFEYDKKEHIFYTKDDFCANWLVTDDEK